MKIGVLGTGPVGRTLAARFAALGQAVVLGTRDVEATAGRREADTRGVPPLSTWLGQRGMPPTLFVKDADCLGEQIQRAFPDARVVKTLNTMTATLQAEPGQLAGGDHSVFVSGDDPDAKQEVTVLLEELGTARFANTGADRELPMFATRPHVRDTLQARHHCRWRVPGLHGQPRFELPARGASTRRPRERRTRPGQPGFRSVSRLGWTRFGSPGILGYSGG